ncbi:serine/arginine repetitive matrix protein 2-like [Oryzias melastigma]|uniref:serine/arginine repetitive matrix protein 2-like n=1 Tax=Oryzias melastigma TaxID=30732 RepID=UPI00168D5710|nr:serine/arginine repetitive matrix protein 2-like [Oryzias melastigma]
MVKHNVENSRGEKEKESGYFSPNRRGDNVQQTEETNKRSYRYFERGRPLPSNYVPEPKACVPYRSVSLGLPSQRRTPETYMQETWRSESPQRYTYHSNFRRGADSQNNSPTRHSSVSPDRYKVTDYPVEPTRGSPLYSSQTRSDVSSQLPSHGVSRHTSGRSSPSRRRGSRTSRTASPSRSIRSHKHTDSVNSQSGEYLPQKSCSRNSRTPSQASNRHSLDSEKLYRNLESLSRRSSTAKNQYEGPQTRPCEASPRTRTTVSSVANTHSHNSRDVSPSRTVRSPQSNTSPRELDFTDSRKSHSQGSWQGSSHSLLSLPRSHASVSSRHGADSQVPSGSPSHITDTDKANEETPRISSDRSRSSLRRGMEILLTSEPKKTPAELEEAGMTIDDYIVLADIPRIQVELEEEFPMLRCRNQSPSPCRDQRMRTYRGQDEADVYRSRLELEERGRVRERGRDRREKCRDPETGRSTLRHSAASVHTQVRDTVTGYVFNFHF